MRPALFSAALLTSTLAGASASADDLVCFEEAEQGQHLRNDGKLLDARVRFIACSHSSCPEVVARECSRWLADVDDRMPSIVFAARDESGKDLLDVRVTIDGTATTVTSDGRPAFVDPGPHAIRFERAGSPPIDQTIVVRAGEKNRPVAVTFKAAPAPAPQRQAVEAPARRVPVGSLILGGAGIVALGVFGYFGLTGVSDYDRFSCDVGCARGDKDKVDTAFVVADIGLVTGVAALAGAVVVYLVQPPRSASASAGPAPALRW